jgi:hypothetical protein
MTNAHLNLGPLHAAITLWMGVRYGYAGRYARAVLLAARNWKGLDAFPRSFLVIVTFLVLWWGTAFSAIGWMLVEASASPPSRGISMRVYAIQEMPRLIQRA